MTSLREQVEALGWPQEAQVNRAAVLALIDAHDDRIERLEAAIRETVEHWDDPPYVVEADDDPMAALRAILTPEPSDD